jgi:hypothetical protein
MANRWSSERRGFFAVIGEPRSYLNVLYLLSS